jgi:uncharacterized membrane protein YfcA
MPTNGVQSARVAAINASPSLTQDLVLNSARELRAEHMREWLRRQWIDRSVAAGAPRWGALAGSSLLCAIVGAHHGSHAEATMLAIAAASLVSSIAGFAFSAVCGAMLFHLSDDPVQVVQIMMTCSIANQAAMTWNMRRNIDWQGLRVYLAGGTCGVAIGVWILLHLDRAAYIPCLGVFLLAYGAYMLLRQPMVIRRQYIALDFAMGLLGGVTGGAAGFPGAAVTIWCGMKGWDKDRQRAVFQPFILIMQVLGLLAITVARQASVGAVDRDIATLLYIPVSLLGTMLGLALYRRMSDNQFARVVNLLLVVSGLSYVL